MSLLTRPASRRAGGEGHPIVAPADALTRRGHPIVAPADALTRRGRASAPPLEGRVGGGPSLGDRVRGGLPLEGPAAGSPPFEDPAALRDAPRLYRARTLDELIPRIVAELGPDAIVLRHERGLTGGFAGFFRRPFVEVEAERGGSVDYHTIDCYDDEDGAVAPPYAVDGATAPLDAAESGAASQPEEAPAPPADAFAAELAHAETAAPVVVEDLNALVAPGEDPRSNARPEDPRADARSAEQCELPALDPSGAAPAGSAPVAVSRGPARQAIESALVEAGVDEALVHEVLAAATAHVLPLIEVSSPPALAAAVRRALAQRIPACRPLPAGGAAIAFVGPGGSGKSACCAALLDAYHRRSTLPAACATLSVELDVLFPPHVPGPIPIDDPLAARALHRTREEGLLLFDTPSLSPADERSIGALAEALAELAPDRVALALPATLGARSAARLLEAYRPLGVSALAVTHVDETDQLGVATHLACTLGIAPAYLLEGSAAGFALTQVEPAELARRLLPPR
jgi:flagellar biosynthesis GTPase FlhF